MFFVSAAFAAAGRGEFFAIVKNPRIPINNSAATGIRGHELRVILGRIVRLNPSLKINGYTVPESKLLYPQGYVPESIPSALTDLPMTEGRGLDRTIYLLTVAGAHLPTTLEIRKFLSDLRDPVDRNLQIVLIAGSLPGLTDAEWGDFAANFRRDLGLGVGTVTIMHERRVGLSTILTGMPAFFEIWLSRKLAKRSRGSGSDSFYARHVDVGAGGEISVVEIPIGPELWGYFECRGSLERP